MAGRIEGKVAVVTGSTGGLGEGIAKMLAAEGAAVIVSGRRDDEGEAVAAAIREAGGQAIYRHADVSRPDDCAALIEAAKAEFGRLDVLVNNAAALAHVPFDELTVEQWDAAFAANVTGPMLLARAAIPLMREQGGGSIVNIGTTMVYRGGGLDRIAYSASKGALQVMTRTLASSLLKDRIRANWVIVGWMATPQEVELRTRTHGDGEKFLSESGEKRPMGRHETPEDIAAGVLYLVSDEASHVTGTELNVSGGLYI